MIALAIEKGASLETLNGLFDLRMRVHAANARRAYTEAMSMLQAELPVVKKLKLNGGTKSNYAPLEDIVAQCKDVIRMYGFTYRWDTKMSEKSIEVICIVTHTDGHSETSSITSEMAAGTSANNAPQKTAITITYLKRYTLCNAFGIMVADEDQDAQLEKTKSPTDTKKPDIKVRIVNAAKHLGLNIEKDTIAESIKSATQLELKEGNYEEVLMRLEALIEERNESN